MGRGVTNLATRQDGELAADPVRDLGRGRDYVQGTDTFTVQTSVLGETLADQQWDTPIDELPDCPSIVVQIATGETLIGAVKEGVVALLQNHICNLTPLFPSRIYTGWVVSAGVEQKDRAVRGGG